ncbi:MAG: hypothetical protein Sylvanvirus25_4 [Sylvanvirus sp.]|uniref:Uncharacterized protein n=1 Tax=Sylvanvirus sp. TaxID=2487774 RepID=A0A3G5AIR6_9VIRU|nr:MAG: hypothetical protein Sylvanvirus25_4 [Sylvanvirus sp.]
MSFSNSPYSPSPYSTDSPLSTSPYVQSPYNSGYNRSRHPRDQQEEYEMNMSPIKATRYNASTDVPSSYEYELSQVSSPYIQTQTPAKHFYRTRRFADGVDVDPVDPIDPIDPIDSDECVAKVMSSPAEGKNISETQTAATIKAIALSNALRPYGLDPDKQAAAIATEILGCAVQPDEIVRWGSSYARLIRSLPDTALASFNSSKKTQKSMVNKIVNSIR